MLLSTCSGKLLYVVSKTAPNEHRVSVVVRAKENDLTQNRHDRRQTISAAVTMSTVVITEQEILRELALGLPLDPLPLAPSKERDPSVPHAPKRVAKLSLDEKKVCCCYSCDFMAPIRL
jgi:hypothetical protein